MRQRDFTIFFDAKARVLPKFLKKLRVQLKTFVGKLNDLIENRPIGVSTIGASPMTFPSSP